MTHTKTIQSLYAVFGRGDIATILEHASDQIDWDHTSLASHACPWNGNFSGKSRLPGFFKALADNLDFTVFEPRAFVETGNHVAVELRIESTLKKNGRHMAGDSVHFWTFDADGKVAKYRHFNDTAQELVAWK